MPRFCFGLGQALPGGFGMTVEQLAAYDPRSVRLIVLENFNIAGMNSFIFDFDFHVFSSNKIYFTIFFLIQLR